MFSKKITIHDIVAAFNQKINTANQSELKDLLVVALGYVRDIESRIDTPYDFEKIKTRIEHELDYARARGVTYADLPVNDFHALLKLIQTGK